MNQQEVRSFIERYFAAFSAHILETHPHYLSVKLPVEVDKDIGNRPFYWSWVEKMNIPPQPMVLNLFFDPEQTPADMRGEQIHFGAQRLQQIFQSTRKHGRFVCMYEEHSERSTVRALSGKRRSTPLTPWLGINVKVSFICDKKKDLLLYLGVNLHQPRVVHDFYPFLQQLRLQPTIPAYHHTLERTISLEQACDLLEQEVQQVVARNDSSWAKEARDRLQEELEILEAYYTELAAREQAAEDVLETEQLAEDAPGGEAEPAELAEMPKPQDILLRLEKQPVVEPVAEAPAIDDVRAGGGRILDFLRMHSIPETPKEDINQGEWRNSTPQEEKERRMEELRWQYEPRIEVSMINGGIFYLHNQPPFNSLPNGRIGRKM